MHGLLPRSTDHHEKIGCKLVNRRRPGWQRSHPCLAGMTTIPFLKKKPITYKNTLYAITLTQIR